MSVGVCKRLHYSLSGGRRAGLVIWHTKGGKVKNLVNKTEESSEDRLKKNTYFGLYHFDYRVKSEMTTSCSSNHKEYRKKC